MATRTAGTTGWDVQAAQGYTPFVTGAIGDSPAIRAAIDAFNASTLPVIQQQLQLQGLGQSPIVASTAASALGQNLVPLLTADMQNRLAASSGLANLYGTQGNLNLGQGRLALDTRLGEGNLALGQGQLSQAGQIAAANIANQQAQRQLQAYGLAGNMLLGLTQPYNAAMTGQLGQQQTALTGYSQAGQLQQGTSQSAMDAARMDQLRLQALAQDMSSGLFGGSTLPPTLTQMAKTTSSGK